MIKVMLSLDIKNAKDNRPEFNRHLAGAGWKKVQNVDTVWLKNFAEYTTLDKLSLKNLRSEIATPLINAHKELKLEKIYYVAQLGNTATISRVVEKRDGVLKAYAEKLFKAL